ncbi:MAG: exodeoxyribonuclease VII small subunit [Hydrogenophilus sp.]|nr:exodeoxyribonuclease VII small subunit [Hydrogenophilus sp.]
MSSENPFAHLTFEEALHELEKVVQQLETGKLTLQESLDHYARGKQLLLRCQEALQAAEEQLLRIEQLTNTSALSEFTAPPDGDAPPV